MPEEPGTDIETQPQKSLTSSAFPISKLPQHHSISHKIVLQSTKTLEHSYFRNFKPQDVIEVRHLQLQWFPLVYGDYFYHRLLKQEYQCLIVEGEVEIEWGKLKNILKQKYKKELKDYEDQIETLQKKKLDLLQPSKYFVCQGITYENLDLENPKQVFKNMKRNGKMDLIDYRQLDVDCQNIDQQSKSSKLQSQHHSHNGEKMSSSHLIKIKIITGVLVFDRALSNGHLGGVFWSETMFGENTSIYINTIGVLPQFRKTGLACKMLDWLIKTTQKQTNFKFVYLHVIDYNMAAIKLYKKMGFQHLETVSDYYNIDNISYKAELLGIFVNGGKRKVGWGQWISSFWR